MKQMVRAGQQPILTSHRSGFTIVELLIVVVVIAILAAITIVSYNGITAQATESTMKSDLSQAAKALESYKTLNGDGATYPANYTTAGVSQPSDTTYTYSSAGTSFCLQSVKGINTFHVSNSSLTPQSGECPSSVLAMQTVTTASCPTSRTLAYDARDNHSYWIQRLADNKCWMLTNLAYAGGGTNTYSDTRALTNDNGDGSSASGAYYSVIPSTTNFTTSPNTPSTSTNGTGQYGYLYNWCGAMGGQATAACNGNATTPTPNTAVTVCPAGWRLPTGGSSSEFSALNTAVNSGSTATDAGLRTTWLAQRSGQASGGYFLNQDTTGYYWSGTQASSTSARMLTYESNFVDYSSNYAKNWPLAVRCVAN